jgi:hypothetical protein
MQYKDLINLYKAINELMMQMGIDGEVSTTSDKAEAVMDALWDVDGGVYDEVRFDNKLTEMIVHRMYHGD